MATFTKFNSFVEALAHGDHDLATDQLAVALCAAANAPVAGNSALADLTQISYTNLSSRNVTTSASAQTGGTYKLTLADLVLTASGGNVGPLRYVVLYNTINDLLIGFYDYGTNGTIFDTKTLTIDFDGTAGALTLA